MHEKAEAQNVSTLTKIPKPGAVQTDVKTRTVLPTICVALGFVQYNHLDKDVWFRKNLFKYTVFVYYRRDSNIHLADS